MGTSSIPEKDKSIKMSGMPIPTCAEHKVPKKWEPTTFEYKEDGVTIKVPNVYAWVCPQDGEASLTSETTDELLATVRELLDTARHARERRSLPTEYIVRVA